LKPEAAFEYVQLIIPGIKRTGGCLGLGAITPDQQALAVEFDIVFQQITADCVIQRATMCS
jgi:hypothetical protein